MKKIYANYSKEYLLSIKAVEIAPSPVKDYKIFMD